MITAVSAMWKVNLCSYLPNAGAKMLAFCKSEQVLGKDTQVWVSLWYLKEGIDCIILWKWHSMSIASSASQNVSVKDSLRDQTMLTARRTWQEKMVGTTACNQIKSVPDFFAGCVLLGFFFVCGILGPFFCVCRREMLVNLSGSFMTASCTGRAGEMQLLPGPFVLQRETQESENRRWKIHDGHIPPQGWGEPEQLSVCEGGNVRWLWNG